MSNCELCSPRHEQLFWENQHFYLLDVSTEEFPCYFRLVSKKHVAEMSYLTPQERMLCWQILNHLETQILEVLKPTKVNFAQFGNVVPHLHWHIIARWENDAFFPECPWGKKQRVPTSFPAAQLLVIKDQLKQALATQLTSLYSV